MKRKLIKIKIQDAGFTMLEVLISLAMLGLIGAGAGTLMSQTFQQNRLITSGMQTIEQVENVAFWMNHDAYMAQSVTRAIGSGFPLSLNWQDTADDLNQAKYEISGSSLERTLQVTDINGTVLSSQQRNVATRINSDPAKTNCSYNGGVLTFQITSLIGTSNQTRSYQAKLRIDQPAAYLTITTTSLPSGYSNEVYGPVTLSAVGGTTPYVWTRISGSLPNGLSLSSSGVISGTPNVGSAVVTYYFSIQAVDQTGKTAVRDYSIIMNLLKITTSSPLPAGQKDKNYGGDPQHGVPKSPVYVAAFGGTTPYIWAVTSNSTPYNRIPPGLSLNTSTGLISGIPDVTTGGNTYTFTIQVSDNNTSIANNDFSISVSN